jgi:hypothetical protein
MKKKKQLIKKIPYIDYGCEVGERVRWETVTGQKFEGVIIRWEDENDAENLIAIVKLDDGTEMKVIC